MMNEQKWMELSGCLINYRLNLNIENDNHLNFLYNLNQYERMTLINTISETEAMSLLTKYDRKKKNPYLIICSSNYERKWLKYKIQIDLVMPSVKTTHEITDENRI